MDFFEGSFALLDDVWDDSGFSNTDFTGNFLDDCFDDLTLPGTLEASLPVHWCPGIVVAGPNAGAPSVYDKAKQFDIAVESLNGPGAFQAWRRLCAMFRELTEQKQLDMHLSRVKIQSLLDDVTCFTYKFRFVELAVKHKLFLLLQPEDARLLVDTMLDIVQHTTHGTHDSEKASNILLRSPPELLKGADLGWMPAKLSTLDAHRNSRAYKYMNLVAKCFKLSKLSSQHAWQVVMFIETRAPCRTSQHHAKSLTRLASLACCAATKDRLLAWARSFAACNTSARSVF